MGMVVRTNVMAMNANRSLGTNNKNVSKSLEKLSSGFRINRAADDASGLAISEKMKAQIKGLEQASANSQDGISLIQTAEGATQEIHNMLNRMTELATKSANGTVQDKVDREAISNEIKDLNKEISRIAESTDFNGIKLLDGTMGTNAGAKITATDAVTAGSAGVTTVDFTGKTGKDLIGSSITIGDETFTFVEKATTGAVNEIVISASATAGEIATAVGTSALVTGATGVATAASGSVAFTTTDTDTLGTSIDIGVNGNLQLQVGDTNDDFNHVSVSVDSLTAEGLGLQRVDVSNQKDAGDSIKVIKDAINKVSTNRANLGSLQNRLEYTISNLDTTAENMTAANSRIRDTDMAKEMMNYTKQNILTQAAQSMLAQANQAPQAILQLLQ